VRALTPAEVARGAPRPRAGPVDREPSPARARCARRAHRRGVQPRRRDLGRRRVIWRASATRAPRSRRRAASRARHPRPGSGGEGSRRRLPQAL